MTIHIWNNKLEKTVYYTDEYELKDSPEFEDFIYEQFENEFVNDSEYIFSDPDYFSDIHVDMAINYLKTYCVQFSGSDLDDLGVSLKPWYDYCWTSFNMKFKIQDN